LTEYALGALLVLTVTWLVVRVRHNQAATKAESRPKPIVRNEYQAVAIKYSENACDAAKAMTGSRFLATEAPSLPLKDCDFPDCRCKFAHYDDRRSKSDRRNPFAHLGVLDGTGAFEHDRRKITDRRKSGDS